MANIDIDDFNDHDKLDAQPDETGKTIPFTPGGGGTWEPECEQEMSFGGTSREALEVHVEAFYQLLSNRMHQRLEPHSGLFEISEDDGLYYLG